MSGISIALQLFSVKNAMQEDIEGTLKKISDIGYEYIEVPVKNTGVDGKFVPEVSADELKGYLEKYNLKMMGSHISYEPDLDLNQIIEYNLFLGSNIVVIPAHFYSTKQDVLDFADWLNRVGERLKKSRISLYYHNHYHEFQEIDGDVVFEVLLDNTNPEWVSFEFDTFWAIRAGIDPVSYLDHLQDRCGLIHQKDLNEQADPVNLLEQTSGVLDSNATFSIVDHTDFVEIGAGIIDIESIIKKIHDDKYVSYIIVEQDRTTKDELESVRESFVRLSELMRKYE